MKPVEALRIRAVGYLIYCKERSGAQRKYFAGFTPAASIHELINSGLSMKDADKAQKQSIKPIWTFDRESAAFYKDRHQGQNEAQEVLQRETQTRKKLYAEQHVVFSKPRK